MFQLLEDVLGSQVEPGVAFTVDPAGQGRIQGWTAEDIVISDEGLGIGRDEMDEFLSDELADVAADDVVEDTLRDGRRVLFIDVVQFGNAFVTARRGIDVVFVGLVQVFRKVEINSMTFSSMPAVEAQSSHCR